MARSRRISRCTSGSLASSLVALTFLGVFVACTRPPEERDTAPPPGEWRSFSGTLSTVGDRRSLDVAPGRQASILDVSGSLLLTGERGIGVGFQARAIAFSDGSAHSVGRAVWTDEHGDRIFSELRGAPMATGQHVLGTITGGTGRWSGIEGEYRFEWTYVIDTESRVQGRSADLRGRARIAAPEGPPP